MKVLVDTCVWSKTLRHKSPNSEITDKIKELIKDGRIVIIGPIRQELLSGISDISQFNRLKDMLSAFEDITLESKHFIKAAEFSNICRQKGVQGSTIDFLICAVANIENLIIFTTDKDFENASSTMKCNTWEAERRNAILSVYVKTIHSPNLVRKRSNYDNAV